MKYDEEDSFYYARHLKYKAMEEGSTITYTCDEIPGIKIESRKRHIPHANREGTWDYTSYFVIKGEKVKEKQSLADAKSLAERMTEDA